MISDIPLFYFMFSEKNNEFIFKLHKYIISIT